MRRPVQPRFSVNHMVVVKNAVNVIRLRMTIPDGFLDVFLITSLHRARALIVI